MFKGIKIKKFQFVYNGLTMIKMFYGHHLENMSTSNLPLPSLEI